MKKIFNFKGIWVLVGYVIGVILQLPIIYNKPITLTTHGIVIVIGIIIILIVNRKNISFRLS